MNYELIKVSVEILNIQYIEKLADKFLILNIKFGCQIISNPMLMIAFQ